MVFDDGGKDWGGWCLMVAVRSLGKIFRLLRLLKDCNS